MNFHEDKILLVGNPLVVLLVLGSEGLHRDILVKNQQEEHLVGNHIQVEGTSLEVPFQEEAFPAWEEAFPLEELLQALGILLMEVLHVK